MTLLPQNTFLGRLELVEVYDYYDKPVLFACRNASDTLFIAVWEDENEEADTWLYVSVSTTRFNQIRSGGIDLNTAFTDPENGFILEVIVPRENGPATIELLPADQIENDRLPLPGQYLRIKTQTLAPPEGNLKRKAEQARREIIQLELDFADKSRTEAPARTLGEILETLQGLVDAFGHAISTVHGDTKTISRDLKSQMELAVLDVGAGSFVVELASSEGANMFDDSTVGDAMEQLLNVLQTGSDADVLKEKLENYNVNVSSNYLKLLDTISKSSIDDTNLIWASPKQGRGGTVQLASPMIFETIDVLRNWEDRDARQIQILGTLIGANIRTKRFEIETNERRYSGRISDQAEDFDFISNATLSQRYQANIREIKTTKIATGEVTTQHELLALYEPPE